jgi:hypothetical protein
MAAAPAIVATTRGKQQGGQSDHGGKASQHEILSSRSVSSVVGGGWSVERDRDFPSTLRSPSDPLNQSAAVRREYAPRARTINPIAARRREIVNAGEGIFRP